MNHFPKILLTFILLTFVFLSPSCTCSESVNNSTSIPPEIFSKANEFIISKTGEEFFKKHITPNPSMTKKLESGYFFVYNFYVKEKPFLSGTIIFTLDSAGSLVSGKEITGIPECIISPADCEFNIDSTDAKAIAKQNGLEQGVKSWEVKFLWNAQFNKYVWYVINTLAESEGGYGRRANGKEIIIDPNNGEILEINYWRVN